MKAFIFDPLWDELVTDELLNQLKSANIDTVIKKEIAPLSESKELFEGDEERVLCLNPDYVGWKLAAEDYKDIPNLKAILIASTGFGWVDQSIANERGIPVCQIVNFSTQAVAEWAITMMFNVARKMPLLIKDGFPLDFDKDYMKYRGTDLRGKTAGIIGLGHNGSAIAERCAGLGMNVSYWSKNTRNDDYTFVEVPELFANADVIFPAIAINEETKSIITPELLRTMKPSAIFITIVEEIYDEEVISEMVKNGKLFGFGFEAPPASFNKYEGNIWAAPAYAWATEGSMRKSLALWVENMVNAAKNVFPHRIN